jgi:hypothetical protein
MQGPVDKIALKVGIYIVDVNDMRRTASCADRMRHNETLAQTATRSGWIGLYEGIVMLVILIDYDCKK